MSLKRPLAEATLDYGAFYETVKANLVETGELWEALLLAVGSIEDHLIYDQEDDSEL